MRRHTANAGFTLVELLMAITILAMVAVLSWRGLDGILRARARLTTQTEQARNLQLAFAQMQRDCDHLAPTSLLQGQSNLQTDDDRVTLVRISSAENAATQLLVVSYRVQDGSLVRRESAATRSLPQLQALWQAALSDQGALAIVTLQTDVRQMTTRYWIDQRWQPTANSSASNNTPLGLAVELTLQDQPSRITRQFLLGAW
ncbi:type II secretion system protein GspJ [Duganella rivi]|nr:type II secretion system protein GspJ [Duganella rivi]